MDVHVAVLGVDSNALALGESLELGTGGVSGFGVSGAVLHVFFLLIVRFRAKELVVIARVTHSAVIYLIILFKPNLV